MNVSLSLLADYANLSTEGKLNIMGIFQRIYASSVPTIHPQMQLVLQFDVEPAERGTQKAIDIHLVDADGNKLASVGQSMVIPSDAPLGSQIPLIATLTGLAFPKYGDYTFHILINEGIKAQVPFKVEPFPKPSEALP